MRQLTVLSCAAILLLGAAVDAAPKGRTISGEVVFEDDHKPEYMTGFRYVGQGQNGAYITGVFGAPNADITVKDAKGEVVGVGNTKPDGTFEILVSDSNFYQLTVEYHGRKIDKAMTASSATGGLRVDVGRFD